MRYTGLMVRLFLPVFAAAVVAAQPPPAPVELPAPGTTKLVQSLGASKAHPSHVWRDTPAINQDGTIN